MMNILPESRRTTIFGLLGVFALVVVIYVARPTSPSAHINVTAPKDLMSQIPKVEAAKSVVADTSPDANASATPSAVLQLLDSGQIQGWLQSREAWVQSRGYFTRKDTEVYETYSDQVLEDLGKKGDMKALHVLAERMLTVKGDMKAAARYANMEAVLGSTMALNMLTYFTSPAMFPKENARVAALETLAITEVIAMRGDIKLADLAMRGLVIAYGSEINLNPEEKIIVDNRAKDIYAKYQAIRTAKGLGDFDNSPETPMGRFFEKR